MNDGPLLYKGRLVIPKSSSMIEKLLYEYHMSAISDELNIENWLQKEHFSVFISDELYLLIILETCTCYI